MLHTNKHYYIIKSWAAETYQCDYMIHRIDDPREKHGPFASLENAKNIAGLLSDRIENADKPLKSYASNSSQ